MFGVIKQADGTEAALKDRLGLEALDLFKATFLLAYRANLTAFLTSRSRIVLPGQGAPSTDMTPKEQADLLAKTTLQAWEIVTASSAESVQVFAPENSHDLLLCAVQSLDEQLTPIAVQHGQPIMGQYNPPQLIYVRVAVLVEALTRAGYKFNIAKPATQDNVPPSPNLEAALDAVANMTAADAKDETTH